jgi:hypothetical protein
MIRGWKRMTRETRVKRTQEATGVSERDAYLIEAVETGRADGDVYALDVKGKPVKRPHRDVAELS